MITHGGTDPEKKQPKAPWVTMEGGIKPRSRRSLSTSKARIQKQKKNGTKKSVMNIRPVSKSRAKQLREYSRLRKLYLEDKPCYLAGLSICHQHPHPATETHHRKGRANELLNNQEFWMAVCRKAHLFIDHNRKQAYELGIILKNWNGKSKPAGRESSAPPNRKSKPPK